MSSFGAISVSQLNEYIKHKFDGDLVLKGLSVSGEISNCKTYSSGHMYFTLKDKNSAVKCVMFKGYRQSLTFDIKDGDSVVVNGDVTVYSRDGIYQLYATRINKSGQGELFLKYLELKNRLESEGLFDEFRKKPLPKYPIKIGVITSDSGAVFHDIKNVVSRRFPIAQIMLFASRVQGSGADEELIAALKSMDKSGCDVAILARGGGSIEDLWQFNSEKLARAIFQVKTPLISAVGHETDYTIADFVSDMRAPTPSAAAEIAVPDIRDLFLQLSSLEDSITASMIQKLASLKQVLKLYQNSMIKTMRNTIALNQERVNKRDGDMNFNIDAAIANRKVSLTLITQKLSANNPLSIINKGYFPIYLKDERISQAGQLKKDDIICIRFADSELKAKVIGGKPDGQNDI